MRVVTVGFSAAGQQKITLDRDTTLVGLMSQISAMVSSNPTKTYAQFITPSSNYQLEEFTIDAESPALFQLNFELKKGSVLYVTTTTGVVVGILQLFFEDPITELP